MQKTSHFVRIYRINRVLLHTITGLIVLATVWPLINQKKRYYLTKWWCGSLLKCFNVEVNTFGQLPTPNISGTMFVANHISWIDIHAMNSILPLKFIAKSEIDSWPIFGYLVRKSGTLFINRNRRKDAARIIDLVVKSLERGDSIGFFPEGTTTDGTRLIKFKSSILQAAVSSKAAVWPVAIYYPLPDNSVNTLMAYDGETTLIESIMNVLRQQNPRVELHFLSPISTHLSDRQNITQTAYEMIAKQLNL